MAYVITQNCCNDAACVTACPVGCIHPRPDEPNFTTAEMLYIDPDTCINCGACADACPVDAIAIDTHLPPEKQWYITANAEYYQSHPISPRWESRPTSVIRLGTDGLRVAIVGTGAAGWYAARSLLRHPGVEVHMYERLPAPGGLVRFGVAPDHPNTKMATAAMHLRRLQEQRLHLHLNVEIGTHLSHQELAERHHAVIYAHGATAERHLEVPGEEVAIGALAFVGWYNGHPEYADLAPDLTARRAVIIGNGNVALDMARVLTSGPNRLRPTDIATHALQALEQSAIAEVVILGRRGPEFAALTTPELQGLSDVPGIDITVDAADLAAAPDSPKVRLLREIAQRKPVAGHKRIVLRFNAVVTEIAHTGTRPTAVTYTSGGLSHTLETGLVLRSIGFRGKALPGVPFDAAAAIIPTAEGKVVGADGEPIPGLYAVGWIRRGPTGGIGTNRSCAEEVVDHVLNDYTAGALRDPVADDIAGLVNQRQPDALTKADWERVDQVELAGTSAGQPRRKLTTVAEILAAARTPQRRPQRLLPLWPLRAKTPV